MNPNNDDEHVVDDRPQMRSVAMMTPLAAPMMPLRSAALPSKPMMATVSADTTVKSEGWKVKSAPPLPDIYLLERTHVHVDAPAQQVASRISDCLYRESIAVRYSPDEVLASARTDCRVQFDIRLWSANNQTLVEIQRCDGCSRSFRHIAKTVLHGARGMSRPSSPVVKRVPDSVRTESMEVTNDCVQEGLEIAMDMINQGRPDMVLLGMESLVQISSSEQCRVYSSKYILNGELGTKLVEIVEEPFIKEGMEHEKVQQRVIKFHALCVLQNKLETLQTSGDLEETLAAHPHLTRSSFLLALVDLVSTFSCCPHAATKSARILHLLIAAGPSCCKSRAANLNKAVERAMSCRHANLEMECEKLRMQL